MKHLIVIGGSVLLLVPASGESPIPCCNGKRGAFDEAFDGIKQKRLANGIGAWLNKSQGGVLERYVAGARWCNISVKGVASRAATHGAGMGGQATNRSHLPGIPHSG